MTTARKPKKNPPRQRTSSLLKSVLIKSLMLLALVVATGGFLLWGKLPSQLGSDAPRVLYEVPENTSAGALVEDLHERKLIAFPRTLRVVLRVTGWETKIRAGYYYLTPRNSVMEIAHKLTSGEMATRAMTIPEGKASWQIFGILRKYFPIDTVVFDSLMNSPEFAASLGIEAPGLEGYLYPDTYVVPWKLKEQDLIAMLVVRFREVLDDLPLEGNPFVEKYGVHGLVTLASIVEKEAAQRREQRRIAGVFQNRLRQGWSLGADPTVRFAVRKMTATLRKDDLISNSPYNTRKFRGLPPGPICSPGESALRATLNPEKTKMMFFVAKDDGSREHYFTQTYADHNAYKDTAAQNRALRRERIRELERELAARHADSLALLATKAVKATKAATDTSKPTRDHTVTAKETKQSAPVAKETKLVPSSEKSLAAPATKVPSTETKTQEQTSTKPKPSDVKTPTPKISETP